MDFMVSEALTMFLISIALYLVLGAGWIAMVVLWWRKWRFVPEAHILSRARREHYPILRIIDGAGRETQALGIKKRPGDVNYDSKRAEQFGIYIDPTILDRAPENRTSDGLPIYYFSTHCSIPISDKNARGILTIIDHARRDHKALDFLGDLEIIELVGNDREALKEDAAQYVAERSPEGVTAEELIEEIEALQEEVSVKPMKQGFFAFAEAFRNTPIAMLPQDIAQLKQIMYRQGLEDRKADIERYIQYGLVFTLFGCGTGIAIYLIKTAIGS
jgi:hypothetical protein